MGTPDYLISAAVTLILAQRLARKTCPNCRVPDEDATPKALADFGFTVEQASRAKVQKGEGCNQCKDSGYKGRMGIYGNMIFEPAVIKVSKGDTIHFKAVDMAHNSATMNGMIPAGAKEWSSELNKDFSIALDAEGVYVYQCDPHAMMAMIGVIQVGEAINLDEVII